MPEKLITYTQKFTVYRTDGDHLGHVKLGALLRYAQQVATAHAEAVGLDDALYRKTHTAYVLAKLALHVTRLPLVDEELTLVTQPERCKRAVNKRITHFYDADGAEVATMDSRWVLIDTEKRMILRKHPEQFGEVPRGESFTLRRARLAEDTFYFDGEREGKSAFEAQLIFKHL